MFCAANALSDAGANANNEAGPAGQELNCLTMTIPGLLAGAGTVNAENALRSLIPAGSTVSQVLIYCGALVLVALMVFGWAVFRTQHRRRHSQHHPKSAGKRHPHHEHRLRNPTLAETGGLPPIRVEKSTPPSV
jgi:hypothetical protein